MNDAEFSQLAEVTFAAIEEAIDANDARLDYEITGSVMTVICEDTDTQVVVSRQAPLKQIWVAAKSGGFHCVLEGDDWVCTTTGETLQRLMSRVCSEQSNADVLLQW